MTTLESCKIKLNNSVQTNCNLHIIILFILLLTALSACNKKSDIPVSKEIKKVEKKVITPEIITRKINFRDIHGKWRLKYGDNYGYFFRFYKNYKSIIILYLKNYSLVFKGVYTIEGNNNIRINIFAMKKEPKTKNINLYRGFTKTKSSYFIFKSYTVKKIKMLIIKPVQIIIDGNTSKGYFEPIIKLKKI